jgi:hypothetical protein
VTRYSALGSETRRQSRKSSGYNADGANDAGRGAQERRNSDKAAKGTGKQAEAEVEAERQRGRSSGSGSGRGSGRDRGRGASTRPMQP